MKNGIRTPEELAQDLFSNPPLMPYNTQVNKQTQANIMTTTASLSTIEINGVTYAPVGSNNSVPTGNRSVVVIDRGWIFAGNVETDEITDELVIHDAIHVFRWESIGFTGVLSNPKDSKVTLKTCPYPVRVPACSVIFTVPVDENWGK